jgi:hypothetical protein
MDSEAPPQPPRLPGVRKWIAVFCGSFLVATGVPVAYATWRVNDTARQAQQTTQEYARHACRALELLTAKPYPEPADPEAEPAREQTYEFYLGLLYWEREDGCK